MLARRLRRVPHGMSLRRIAVARDRPARRTVEIAAVSTVRQTSLSQGSYAGCGTGQRVLPSSARPLEGPHPNHLIRYGVVILARCFRQGGIEGSEGGRARWGRLTGR